MPWRWSIPATGALLAAGGARLAAAAAAAAGALMTSGEGPYGEESDPYAAQASHLVHNMQDFERRLDAVRARAQESLAKVRQQEERLTTNFLPTKKTLGRLTRAAAAEARKAENQVVKDRLSRIHYKQVGVLDRAARFWEDSLDQEQELRRIAAARLDFEQAALNVTRESSNVEQNRIKEVQVTEKKHIDRWLQNFEAQLSARERMVADEDPVRPRVSQRLGGGNGEHGRSNDKTKS